MSEQVAERLPASHNDQRIVRDQAEKVGRRPTSIESISAPDQRCRP